MDERENAFLRELLAAFQVEAAEHLSSITSALLQLEKIPADVDPTPTVESAYREAHTLKGAARAANVTAIEEICQSLESVFRALKRGEIGRTPELFDTLHHSVDAMGKILAPSEGERVAISALVRQLALLQAGEREAEIQGSAGLDPAEGHPAPPAEESEAATPFRHEKPAFSEMVRISAAKLGGLLLQTEELLSLKPPADQRAADLQEVVATIDLWNKEWARLYPALRAVRGLVDRAAGQRDGQDSAASPFARVLEFLDWNHAQFRSLEGSLRTLAESTEHDNRSLGGMVDSLVGEMKKVVMLPSSSLLELFPKLVRDLSRDRAKEVELLLQGGEVEIDRRILQEMKDPLIQLLRNCVDHGIEKADERGRKGKLTRGTIALTVSQIGGNRVEFAVSDDGAGIDLAKVRAAAARRGMSEASGMSDQEALSLIFRSELSTSSVVTDLSGRGLGLAIVRERVERLGGTVSVETRPGGGSSFRMRLPLTLATFRGTFVQEAGQQFVVPTVSIDRVARIRREAIHTVENRETISMDGRSVPFARLGDVLELPQRGKQGDGSGFLPVLVLGTAEARIAFGVDRVLSEQEVLVKGLGRQLSRVRNIAGATVLGSGKVVPILHVSDLLKSAVRAAGSPAEAVGGRPTERETNGRPKSVLVVEDSITSRMLLKNILESAGYRVRTAVDGVDAYTALRSEEFDLVVSDVQMPRMDGFDLTAKIRADRKLTETPVVLVTSLESASDRERGIDVGANAYIVKSSFDHNNLLSVVGRLL